MNIVKAERVLGGYSGTIADPRALPKVDVRIRGNTATVSFPPHAFVLSAPRPDTFRTSRANGVDMANLADLARTAREDEEAGRTRRLDSLNDLA